MNFFRPFMWADFQEKTSWKKDQSFLSWVPATAFLCRNTVQKPHYRSSAYYRTALGDFCCPQKSPIMRFWLCQRGSRDHVTSGEGVENLRLVQSSFFTVLEFESFWGKGQKIFELKKFIIFSHVRVISKKKKNFFGGPTMARAKNVVWTCFDISPDVEAAIQAVVSSGDAHYCVYGHEVCPETKKEHLQGFTMFTKQMRWNAVKKLFKSETLHCEVMRGTPVEASDYCKKDRTGIYESGDCPTVSQGKRSDLLEVVDKINTGAKIVDIAQEFPAVFIRNHKGIAHYKAVISPKRNKHTISLVVYGASDSGKTHWVRETFPGALWLTKGATSLWFDEYDDHDVIVFDEFCGGVMSLTWFKRLIDKTPLTLDAKGSSRNINPALVVFISNTPPEEWYSAEVLTGAHRDAFNRRLHNVIRVDQLVGLHDEKLPRFRCRMEKAFLPFDCSINPAFTLGCLSHEKSLEFLSSSTSDEVRKSLRDELGSCGSRIKDQSGGVILTPPTFLSWENNVTGQLNKLVGFVFGQDGVPAGTDAVEPSDLSAFTPGSMIVVESRQVSNPTARVVRPDQVLPPAFSTKRTYQSATSSDSPVAAVQAPVDSSVTRCAALTKNAAPLKRTRIRRKKRCVYIDDEAECSDDDSDSSDSHESASSSASTASVHGFTDMDE